MFIRQKEILHDNRENVFQRRITCEVPSEVPQGQPVENLYIVAGRAAVLFTSINASLLLGGNGLDGGGLLIMERRRLLYGLRLDMRPLPSITFAI